VGGVPPVEPRKVIKNIGRRVAEERKRLGLTQASLAERAGVSLKYWQRVEAGRENLTIASLVRFANLVRVEPIDLLRQARLRNARPGRPVSHQPAKGPRPLATGRKSR
jgi:transcriptional regulator with XRE-family HTH domain